MPTWVLNVLEDAILRAAADKLGHPLRVFIFQLIRARAQTTHATPEFAAYALLQVGWAPQEVARDLQNLGVQYKDLANHWKAGQTVLRRDLQNDPLFGMLR
jgi:hypothetical protein